MKKNMPKILVEEIAGIIEGKLYGRGDSEINNLLYDSRRIVSPDKSLFFALPGERNDGHNYISDLYHNGVKNFVVSQLPAKPDIYKNTCFILVGSTIDALHKLASNIRDRFKGRVIAITGSNGKTITKEWVYQVLSEKHQIIRSPRSYNSQVGVPLTLWLLDNSFEYGIIEAGISKPGEMKDLEEIIKPDIGIITNLREPHQQNFESLKEKTDEKLKLFKNARVIIYCSDHEIIDNRIKLKYAHTDKKTFTWSRSKKSDLKITRIKSINNITNITARFNGGEKRITIPFVDKASIENAIHVWCLSIQLGLDERSIEKSFKLLDPVSMRLEQKRGINNCTLVNDAYNSDFGSLSVALDFLNLQNQNMKKTLILSDIYQSGKIAETLYKDVSNLIRTKGISRIIGIGEEITKCHAYFSGEKKFYNSTDEFIKSFNPGDFQNEAVLLKGARNFRFEEISGLLEKQSHQTVLEIDLDAMINNLNYFKSKLEPDARIMVMVKAFSYGSGTYEIANVLQYHGVDYLAVAYTDEGVVLRKSGITVPIMVMNSSADNFENLLRYNLEPEIYNFELFEKLVGLIKKSGLTSFPVHLKIDTGMHRLGFMQEDIDLLIQKLIDSPVLYVKSLFTHLAASEDPEYDQFTEYQANLFQRISNKITGKIGYPVVKHILNSAGIERHGKYIYDMVRLGIGLYGISSINSKELRNIGTFKTTISQIKSVPPNQSVGYGRKGVNDYRRDIAVLPVGYADGFNRKLGNGVGQCYINGKYVPVTGNICMDMCMVDITGIRAEVGDEVEIFGKHIPVETVAAKIDTIPYEILTAISERVKRIYFHG